MKKIRLTTYQSKEAIDILLKEGVLRLRKEDRRFTHLVKYDNSDYNFFEFPYRFMIERMKDKLPSPKYKDTYYPIWSWYKVNGRYKCSKEMDKIHQGLIKVIIKIDENRLLFSDFDMFAAVISGARTLNEEDENKEPQFDKNIDVDSFFDKSLDNMFVLHRKKDHYYGFSYRHETIQAIFWELYLEDVIEIVEETPLKV